jgi:lipopolysaccharide/colanic/teichoic acid biosynthesis glycosyltransferase
MNVVPDRSDLPKDAAELLRGRAIPFVERRPVSLTAAKLKGHKRARPADSAPEASPSRGRPVSADPAPADEPTPWAIRVLSSRRAQLIGVVLIAVALPALFRWPSTGGPSFAGLTLRDPGITNGLLGSFAATLLGFVTFRQLKNHPGVNSAGYVLYAFGMTYASLAILLLFLRADYSRYQLATSFVLTVAWFLAIHRIVGRHTVLRLAVILHRSVKPPEPAPKVAWIVLTRPDTEMGAIGGVVADLRAEHPPEWERFMARCTLEGIPVYDVKQIAEQLTGKVEIGNISENSLGSTLHSLVYARMKRLIDLLGALVVAPVFALAIGLAAIAIRLDDGGPALFRQLRVGYRGHPFVIYKLRTMHADPQSGAHFTAKADPRVTRLGGFLRKYRIDELPQIWNIFKGDMSWIGPRPEAVALSEWYEREVPFYCYRHVVRPGITGWAQVNQGNVAKIDAATEKLHYDFYYIKHLSPWLDLLIGAKTIQTILTGFGAL